VILVIALVAFSAANAFEFTNLLEVKELRKTSYGNSLIETVSLALQANPDNFDEVGRLLTEILYDINQDQEAADAKWKSDDAALEEKINKLNEEIADLKTRIAADEAEQARLEDLIEEANKNLDQYHAQKAENDAALVQLKDNRDRDAKEFEHSRTEHTDLVNAIEQVVNELQKLVGSISGAGRPEHVAELAHETRDREFAAATSFVQLQLPKNQNELMAFLQTASKANQESLQKLIGVLNGLKASAQASLNADEQHEQNSREAYDTLLATLENDNIALVSNIEAQEINLKNYQDQLEEVKGRLAQNREQLANKEQELAATIQERIDVEAAYKQEKEDRAAERAIVEKLQRIFNERLANASSFLRERAAHQE